MTSEHPSSPPDNAPDMRELVILWGVCCMSPIMYLAASALIKQYFMQQGGLLMMSDAAWRIAMISLAVWVAGLQASHFVIKKRYRNRLAESQTQDPSRFLSILKKRTFVLVALSELAVFAGFCLFLCQGDLKAVFASGIAAMLLYAQSHPKSGQPPQR